jgi:hypothetical protein
MLFFFATRRFTNFNSFYELGFIDVTMLFRSSPWPDECADEKEYE